MRHSSIDAGELERELRVIIQEAKRKLDTPDAVTYETLHELMFDHHRIRRWRIGTEEQLSGYTREDVAGYYQSRYVPERTIVSVVGAVPVEETLAVLRAAYGDWTAAPGAVDPSPPEPRREGVRARTLRGDVTRAELSLGWRTVDALHPDSVPLDVAAAVLSAGRGSWLYRILREPGVVTGIGASNYAPGDVGVFSISADVEPARLDQALEGIASATSRLALLGPGEADLNRARTLLLARWARRNESMEGRASALASAEALGRIELLDEEYERLGTVTADDVREVARRYLLPESVSGVVYLPDGVGDDLTAGAPRRIVRRGTAHDASCRRRSLPPPARAPARGEGIPHRRGAACAAGRSRHPDPPEARGAVGKPGLLRAARCSRKPPRWPVSVPSRCGRSSAVPVRSMAPRSRSRPKASAARSASSAGIDWSGLSLPVLSENLAAAANLLRLAAFEPAFHELDVLTERGLLLEEARQVADDMFRYPFLLAFGAAFRDRGYGRPVGGTVDTLPTLSIDDVRAWHRTSFAGRRGALVVVGDLDPDAAAAELAGVFGDVPGVRSHRRARGNWCSPSRTTGSASRRGRRRRRRSRWCFPAPTGATRGDTPPTCGVRSRAGWAAASSTRCVTVAHWRTPSSVRPGPAVMVAPSSRISPRHRSGRRKRGPRC